MQPFHTGFNPIYSEDAPTPDDISVLVGDSILEFGAPWCGHCMAAESAIEKAFTNHPDLPHIKIYDGKGKKLGRAFKVKLWPTLILLRDGVEVGRLIRPTQAVEVQQLLAR
ncbi:MAG TPA: thioredoxin [Cycloclasticus sp.]|jgi:thioredoxin 1|nr:thioredoxin [Cycloclasticus sp.]HIL92162.1 thioredoxin [Cycloclasticus sp.]